MTQTEDYSESNSGWPRVQMAATVLTALAVGLAVFALIAFVIELISLTAEKQSTTLIYLAALRNVLLGLAGAAFLWGLAELLRVVEETPYVIREYYARQVGLRTPWIAAANGDATEEGERGNDLGSLLREIRDISLLSPEERSLRLRAQAGEAARELSRIVPDLLRSHNWVEARRRVQQARERYPLEPTWNELEQRIEEVRAGVEARDIDSAKRQVHDLASLGAWERAFDVVRDLLERHPDSDAARELARYVQEQRGKVDAEERRRLIAQVQEAAKRREWSTALNLATALIKQYPNSPESEALRSDLPTLQENVEIQTRKRMEAEITELTRAKRYNEALEMARELIARYPRSPQAAVLLQSLPQLEARASVRARR